MPAVVAYRSFVGNSCFQTPPDFLRGYPSSVPAVSKINSSKSLHRARENGNFFGIGGWEGCQKLKHEVVFHPMEEIMGSMSLLEEWLY